MSDILSELKKNLGDRYAAEATPPPPPAPDRQVVETVVEVAAPHPITQALRDHFKATYEGERR